MPRIALFFGILSFPSVVFVVDAFFGEPAEAAAGTLTVARVSPEGLSGAVGQPVADSVVVAVTDARGKGIAGVPVRWDVTQGGGTIDPVSTSTDRSGRAAARWTLGEAVGSHEAMAVISGVADSTVLFSATASAGRAARVEMVTPEIRNDSSPDASQSVAVRVTDRFGNGVAGTAVAWTVTVGGGTVSPESSRTNSTGLAGSEWTAGDGVGGDSLTAVVSGLEGSPVAFGRGAARPPALTWIRRMTGTPGGRSGHAMAYDVDQGAAMLFGGQTAGTPAADMWRWSTDGWTELTPGAGPGPGARFDHAIAYDLDRHRMVLFAGSDGTEPLDDTWFWETGAWTRVSPTQSPPSRSGHAMVHDPTRGVTVLFGGEGSGGLVLGDTWEFDGVDWASRRPSVIPPARTGHAMAYDAGRQRIVLFGGRGRGVGVGLLNDTWEWDGVDWTRQSSATRPSPRFGHAMVYDRGRNRIVLFGGTEQDGGNTSDTWEWDGADWIRQRPDAAPPPRPDPAMVFDAVRGTVVLFSGDPTGGLSDTWEYRIP